MIQRYPQWRVLLLALLLFAIVFIYNAAQMQPTEPPGPSSASTPAPPEKLVNGQKAGQKKSQPAPAVSVLSVQPLTYQAQISAFGSARPQYQLSLKAQVNGQVISIADQFNSGLRINRNTALLRIDDSDYRAALANAKAEVADARLKLLEAEREAIQAKTEWQAAGLEGEPDSDLVLHRPQLLAARATLEKAQASLSSARRDQKNTHIVAPFDALIVERLVSPGSYVQTGSEIATLFSSQQMEISLPLPDADWNNIPDSKAFTNGDYSVQLTSVENKKNWQARILRVEQHLDETTRQRTLIVAVDHPLDQSPALFPGTFVQAHIQGRKVSGLWRLPDSAISQRGEIWYLNKDNTLARFSTTPLFSDAHFIYVAPPTELLTQTQQVILHPLNSYIQGMTVNKKLKGDQDE